MPEPLAGRVLKPQDSGGVTPLQSPLGRSPLGRLESEMWLRDNMLAQRMAIVRMMEAQHENLLARWTELCEAGGSLAGGSPRADQSPRADGLAGDGQGANLEATPWQAETQVDAEGVKVCMEATDASTYEEVDKPAGLAHSGTGNMDPRNHNPDALASMLSAGDESGEIKGNLIQRIVAGSLFEVVFGLLITLNAMVLAVERQVQGMKSREILLHGAMTSDWSSVNDMFEALEWGFGLLFVMEVIIKILVLKQDFFLMTGWNVFDFFVVSCWVVDRMGADLGIDAMLLRLARLSRLVRLLRILRWSAVFDPLILLVKSVKASVNVLGWSVLLLNLVIAIMAMTCSELLENYIRNPDIDIAKRWEVFGFFGSFTTATETIYEVTLANWGPPCRLLMNNVNEWWGLFFIIYKLCVGFAVVQVVISVFIQQTFKVASRDEELMIRERKTESQAYSAHLEKLFAKLDASGDGLISRDEFNMVLQDDRILTWFAALEVDFKEVAGLFDLLDDGDGEISHEEFIIGVMACKGSAKGTDMLAVSRDVKVNRKLLKSLEAKMDGLLAAQHALLGVPRKGA